MTSPTWFVRVDGKVRGPFALAQLEQLLSRGLLDWHHEVSEDRLSWQPLSQHPQFAARIPVLELAPQPARVPPPPPPRPPSTPVIRLEDEPTQGTAKQKEPPEGSEGWFDSFAPGTGGEF